jgi:hypothetical protein
MGGTKACGGEGEPRERMTSWQRRRVGLRLQAAWGRDRDLARRFSEAYGVTAHWIRKQRRRLERGERLRRKGRPRHPEAERARVRELVLEQFEAQGIVGWRAVLAGIRRREAGRAQPTSTMLVQQETSALKRRIGARSRRAREHARRGHEVTAREAVWAEDATHVGRLEGGEELQAEMATDRATTRTVILAVGPPATGKDICRLLDGAKEERGALPLVWQSDEGSANRSEEVRSYLEKEQVIHLRSRVHTPTDNPVPEHKNREIKEESGLGKGVGLADASEAEERIEWARFRIDEGRLRASRGWRTAAELDQEMPRAEALVTRAQFYGEACSAMREAVLGLSDAKEIRRAEQEAVWRTLERHGAARRHVGSRPTPCPRLPPVAPAPKR